MSEKYQPSALEDYRKSLVKLIKGIERCPQDMYQERESPSTDDDFGDWQQKPYQIPKDLL